MSKKFYTCISMMSGTSMDGVDAVLIKLFEDSSFEIIDSHFLDYPESIREKLSLIALNKGTTEDICKMNFILGRLYARCVNELLKKSGKKSSETDFISSHGQTVFHSPEQFEIGGYKSGSTLQIGDISVIAADTDILTIGDFRCKDIALGGQGAPLVPFADEIIFGREKNRAIQNIGGISNVTVLSSSVDTFAFDNGPGNMLIDFAMRKFFSKPYDKNGEIAATAPPDEKWLDYLLKDEYYSLTPPKSTGREHYNDIYFDKIMKNAPSEKHTIISTLTELTSKVIYDSYVKFVFPKSRIDEVIIGGGGAYNQVLMKSLQKHFKDIPVKTHKDFGLDDKLKEAVAFAFIALNAFLRKPNNVPSCTGASRYVSGGKLSYPD